MQSNPFNYGTVVSGKDFADRQDELKELNGRLKETVRIFLLAPRRYGKTSGDLGSGHGERLAIKDLC